MSSKVDHFSHPEHLLVLKGEDVIAVDATCSVCSKPVVGTPTYTCSSGFDLCQNFYLHTSCAELSQEIIRFKKHHHPLTLLPRPQYICSLCRSFVKFAYACEECDFDMCVSCDFVIEERGIRHQGHPEHTLTLQREAPFNCDACWETATDYSYICLTCDFWIHKKCASSPPIIQTPTYHHHPLTLIFSIPDMHRYFRRLCFICKKKVHVFSWSYYCHKCTFFVHLKCSTSTLSLKGEIQENNIVINEPDLVQFPLSDEESLFDLIITQCSKLQVQIQGRGENSVSSKITSDPHIIEEHWSHRHHPLELHQLIVGVDDNNDNDDRRVLICDGCIQPITISHPWYYTCIECGFFLHSFCANKLPAELPVGASTFHPQHSLFLDQQSEFYSFVKCGICSCPTNGFYYRCVPCDIQIDIRCTFLPAKIRHKSHKHHSLLQQTSSNKVCSVSCLTIGDGLGYACGTCSNFVIHPQCAFYPRRMKHRYDDHSLILRLPPFFYEGVFYCQICEEQVNNQWWLYHCEVCDQSFHEDCLHAYENVKLGGTVKHSIYNQSHTLELVFKSTARKNSPPYLCAVCGDAHRKQFFFECGGCGYLACISCIRQVNGE